MGNRIAVWSLGVTAVGTLIALAAWLLPSDGPNGGSPPSPVDTTVAAEGPTKEDYIRLADDICHKWSVAAGESAGIADDLERAREQRRILTNMVFEWRSVTPPPADRAVVDEIIDRYQEAADLADQMVAAWERGDAATVQRLDTLLQQESDEAMRESRAYGFRVC